ncbi:MAG: stearoyl-CoA 9-desaturase [Gammaproteobacteria bacterium]|nr:stearoyl-CoA 9-desaturase [Gammaproteobacteria bacterium]
MKAVQPGAVPRNWITTAMFAVTFAVAVTVVPWYGISHGYQTAAWVWFTLLVGANGMAITCGYHRLFAHATYEAHPVLKVVYLLFGAMALQNSALIWAAGHRVHHRHIDDTERDPYCAKLGFWFSHIGWMLKYYPSGDADFSAVRDLERDRLLRYQHRYYVPLTIAMNVGLPLAIGWVCGDMLGMFLLAGVLRLVVSHHVTFLINSLAHIWGSQPYTEDNTARDNPVVALLTYGEGYHNFHHMFAHDYRNGVRLWQWDPSKWFIAIMSWLGLARNLKRVPWFKIQRALLDAQFRRAEWQLSSQPGRVQIEQLKRRVAEEYEVFSSAVTDWTHLREQWLVDKKRAMLERWERSILQSRLQELEHKLKIQYQRMRVLGAQIAFTVT